MITDAVVPAILLAHQVAPYVIGTEFVNPVGRKKQNWEGSSYILPADDRERQRLALVKPELTAENEQSFAG